MKKYLLFGVIASVLSINAYAVSATVTSKDYVDTTRQATIPASGTNASTPGDTVVTYTSTAGTIGERGIFNPQTDFDFNNNEVATGHEGDLLDAGSIFPNLVGMSNAIQDIQDNMPDFDDLPETTVTYKTCYQEVNGECILWNLTDKDVYGVQCHSSSDCPCYENGQFVGQKRCENGVCTGGCLVQ